MRVLGIDPGTWSMGYGVIDHLGGRSAMVACGAIRSPKGRSLAERLNRIFDELTRLIEEHQPACLAIEDVFHGRNFRSAVRIGESRGVAILAAQRFELPVSEYPPAVVKKSVVGNGGAHKVQIQHMVRSLLGLSAPPEPDDAADALAIALCHCHRL
ncbi:MAG: crossover junction endodeoxyribonuclease RuvC [Planctomycetota bacterium]